MAIDWRKTRPLPRFIVFWAKIQKSWKLPKSPCHFHCEWLQKGILNIKSNKRVCYPYPLGDRIGSQELDTLKTVANAGARQFEEPFWVTVGNPTVSSSNCYGCDITAVLHHKKCNKAPFSSFLSTTKAMCHRIRVLYWSNYFPGMFQTTTHRCKAVTDRGIN